MAADTRKVGRAPVRSRRASQLPDAAQSRALRAAAERLFEGDPDEHGPAAESIPWRAISVASSGLSAEADSLFAEERIYVERAVESRRREFATGRHLARQLLEAQGVPRAPLLRDQDRVPLWPAGYQGSISHTREWCLVAVARAGSVRGLGVDVEIDTPLKSELLETICTAAEIERLPEGAEGLEAATLHFSIKEAVYKACYPTLRERWDFLDVEIELEPSGSRFTARAPVSVGRPLTGRVLRSSGFILSAAVWV